jgi:hypothetical protein
MDELTVKPKGYFTSRDIATMFNLPIRKVTEYSKLLKIPKDTSGLYIYTEKELARFKEFLSVINKY